MLIFRVAHIQARDEGIGSWQGRSKAPRLARTRSLPRTIKSSEPPEKPPHSRSPPASASSSSSSTQSCEIESLGSSQLDNKDSRSRPRAAVEPNLSIGAKEIVFSQGDAADSIFYILRGKIKIVVTSKQGREAVVAVLGEGDFFGEGCLIAQPLRLATAASMIDATVMRVEKAEMLRLLHAEPHLMRTSSPKG
jgi:CRP-like cAMP-binding protein